jgi:hypothetical protein
VIYIILEEFDNLLNNNIKDGKNNFASQAIRTEACKECAK